MGLVRGTPQVNVQVAKWDGHRRIFGCVTQFGEMTVIQGLVEYQWSSFVIASANHDWGKPSHYYTLRRSLVITYIVVAGLAPVMTIFHAKKTRTSIIDTQERSFLL